MKRTITVETKDYAGNRSRRAFTHILPATEFVAKTLTNTSMKRVIIWMGKNPPSELPLDTAADAPSE